MHGLEKDRIVGQCPKDVRLPSKFLGDWGFRLFIGALLLLFAPLASAQMEVSKTRDSVRVGQLAITGYPYVFYSPETQFAIGGALIFAMRTDADPKEKASNAMLSGYYSEKGSYDLFLNPEVFLGDYYLTASIDYYRFVDKFWGIGNNTPDIDTTAGYIRNAFWTNLEFDVSVLGPLKLGLNYDLNITGIEDKQSNPYLLAGSLTGNDGGVSSGLGLVLFVDTRNNAFSPSDGGSYKLSALNAAPWTGSQFTFTRFILDARHYLALAPPLVLAMQVYGSAVTGAPPFYMLPALGGDNIMRGYYEGRYRDKIYFAAQAEFRVRLTNRWGLVAFAGVGDVSGSFSSFKLTQAKPSYGLGVRFMLDTEELLNVRADFARGKDTKGMYFNAKEAF